MRSPTPLGVFTFSSCAACLVQAAHIRQRLGTGLPSPNLWTSKSNLHQSPPRRALQTETLSLPPGLWMTRGYGYVVQAGDNQSVAFLEETAVSCVFLTDRYEDAVSGIILLDNSTAEIDVGTNAPYIADKIESFQGACANGLTEPQGSVLQDWDIIVQTFNEHYAYFEERGVTNWDEITAQVRATMNLNSTLEDLAVALESILGPLNDAHVFVAFDDLGYEFVSKPNSLIDRLLDEFEEQTEVTSEIDYINGQLLGWFDTLDSYLSIGLNGSPGLVTWGGENINGTNVGYLNIFTFGPDDELAFITLFRTALVALEEADVLVIDIRVNTGGSDVLAVYCASHFASEETLAYTLQPRDGQVQGGLIEPPVEVFMRSDPLDIDLVGIPIVLLQSEVSVSAAETFASSVIELPQVTTVGQPTAGAFSDTLVRSTPGGWTFGLSNEYVRAPDGTVYEGMGIPATVMIPGPVLPLADRETGVDSWLEIAFHTAVGLVTPNTSMPPTPTPSTSPTTLSPSMQDPTSTPTSMPDSGGSVIATKTVVAMALLVSAFVAA